MNTRTLYDISSDLTEIENLLLGVDGDVSDPEIESRIDAYLSDLMIERDVKLDNYGALIREMETRAAIRSEEAKRLSCLAAKDSNAASRLKTRLQAFFIEHGMVEKVATRRFSFKLAKNGGKIPIWIDPTVIDEPENLDERFHYTAILINKDAIRSALEAGEELEFAKVLERGQNLRIN